MANQGGLRDHPAMQHIALAAVQGRRDRLLDVVRALMLLGAAALVSTVVNPDGGDATQIFPGFVIWLLGACLLSLVPVAGLFPLQAADAFAGAAIANVNAVLRHLYSPWN